MRGSCGPAAFSEPCVSSCSFVSPRAARRFSAQRGRKGCRGRFRGTYGLTSDAASATRDGKGRNGELFLESALDDRILSCDGSVPAPGRMCSTVPGMRDPLGIGT